MSHMATVECMIKDLEALEEAAKNKGGALVKGKTEAKFYGGAREKCSHAITHPNSNYEIGVRRLAQADEAYELRYDGFDGTLNRAFGNNLEGLRNEYLAVVAEQQLERGRYRFSREAVEGEPNTIRLVARR